MKTAHDLTDEEIARLLRDESRQSDAPEHVIQRALGVYRRRAEAQPGLLERIVAMLSLETIGCYSDQPGRQQYPFLYPEQHAIEYAFFYPKLYAFIYALKHAEQYSKFYTVEYAVEYTLKHPKFNAK